MNSQPSSIQKFRWTDLAVLFALALLIRTLAALPQQQPNYMDAAYSYVNAVNLAEGRGFVEDFLWNYLGHPKQPPPHPSHLYWMPLTSILAWSGMVVGGVSYRAAQIPFIIISALLAPISYWVAYALAGQRWSSWLAGLFAIFSGFYFPFWTAIDNFTPFAIAGSLAILFAWRGLVIGNWRLVIEGLPGGQTANDDGRWTTDTKQTTTLYLITSGVFIGLAHLARADGLLLLIAIILVYFLHLLYYVRRPSSVVRRPSYYVLRFTVYLLLGYLLVMLPWFIRNWQVSGTLLPTTGSQTIWLTGYDDLFSYNRQLSAQSFFAQGLGPVLQGRWWAFTTNLQTIVAVWGMIFLTPLALIEGWQLRHQLLVQMVSMYGLLLFIVMTLVFAFPGARGGLFHSGAAILPFIYGLAMVGLDRVIDWAATRRQWDAQTAKRVLGVGLVVIALALSGFIYYQRVLKNNAWNNADRFYPAIATWLAHHDPTGIVMIGNPPAYRYHGGGLSVVVPNENIETTLQAAQYYHVDYLVLDSNHPAPLTELYHNPTHYPTLSLVQTFGEGTGNKIYLFEIIR